MAFWLIVLDSGHALSLGTFKDVASIYRGHQADLLELVLQIDCKFDLRPGRLLNSGAVACVWGSNPAAPEIVSSKLSDHQGSNVARGLSQTMHRDSKTMRDF